MNHLIICREYPPARGGGIGTYVSHISRLLAKSGETVHVIGQLWKGAEKELEEDCSGRLIVHRVPLEDWSSFLGPKPSPAIKVEPLRGLFESGYYPQCFSWQASLLAERIIDQEGIDILEAQDYEAPLYYFQLRRALGFGPKRRLPCFIHLHSPTEFIAQYDDWDRGLPGVVTAKRLEDYSIATADALLCPSRYLARQVETRYGLGEGSIRVIPYPLGDSTVLQRDKDTWDRGTICYVGRLERRKGVIEWIDAAVAIAPDYPEARFEFVGANVLGTHRMSGEALVKGRIPRHLRMRFHFRGQQKPSLLPEFRARARMAVIPSRWENFPYTCVEAMGSGLPVIASREGGMVEMIEDGRSGWLACKPGTGGLAEALRRALETPGAKVAEMGRYASEGIRRMCDNEKIVDQHLEFHSHLVDQGSRRSFCFPANLPWARTPFSREPARRNPQSTSQKGLAIVVASSNSGQSLDPCLQSLEWQTRKPEAVVVVYNGSSKAQEAIVLEKAQRNGWLVIDQRNGSPVLAKNAGIKTLFDSGLKPLGFVFLSGEDRLRPDFVTTCESVLQRCPEVGLISCWACHPREDHRLWIRPCPSFPYQWVTNDAAPFSVVRTEALREAGNFRPVIREGYEDWDLANAVMAAGWVAVTVPEILAEHRFRKEAMPAIASAGEWRSVRKELHERFSELVARDVADIALLVESASRRSRQEEVFMMGGRLGLVQKVIRHPRRTASYVLRKAKNKILHNSLAL
jgi:glycogen synthase